MSPHTIRTHTRAYNTIRDAKPGVCRSMYSGERRPDERIAQANINDDIEIAPAETQGLTALLEALTSSIDDRYSSN